MSLRNQQSEFAKDVSSLLVFIHDIGFEITFGETQRTEYQQKEYLRTGKTKTLKSNHLRKLAIDLNFFDKGELTYSKSDLQIIGDYWENLNDLNRWGGNFKNFTDTPHFERNV